MSSWNNVPWNNFPWNNVPWNRVATPSWTALLCWARISFEVAIWLHCLQGYLTPSWAALLCLPRLLFEVAIWSHCLQGYFNPSWTALLCLARIPFEVAIWSHCLPWSPLHEQLFCVELDYSLKLPYGHIAYKGTSPLHETIMCTSKETISCTLSKNNYNFSLE